MNVEFRKQLIDVRAKYDLTQRDMAEIAGIAQSTYQGLERGRTSDQSKAANLLRDRVLNNKRLLKRFAAKQRERMNKHRIPNIPNFYERLAQVEDKQGDIRKGVNDEVLKDLQIDLGIK